jgi:protein SCO1
MPSSRSVLLTIFAGVLAILAFAVGLYIAQSGSDTPSRPEIEGLLWPDPPRLESFSLTDMHGAPLSERGLAGKWTLLFFGFTHCPDVCPTTLKTLHGVAAKLQTHPTFQAAGLVLFISVDPARDDPVALREYVQYFDPKFLGATGTDEEIKRLARQIGIIFAQVKTNDPKNYSMDHTASVFLLSPRLELLGVFSPPHTVDALTTQIQSIIDFMQKEAR